MAEILIKAIDAKNPDPIKDQMCYKRGDIVEVFPDGFNVGSFKECRLPKFVVLKIPGLSVDKVKALIESHEIPKTVIHRIRLEDWQQAIIDNKFSPFITRPVVLQEGAINGKAYVEVQGDVMVKSTRRKWGFLIDNLPQSVINAFKTTGEYTTTLSQIRTYVKHKITGATF